MSPRRSEILCLIFPILLVGSARGDSALVTPATDEAIDRGLRYLAQEQDEDGSFGSIGYGRNAAVVGLGGIAMLGSGSTPGRGPYGANIDRCIQFLLANTDASGFVNPDGASSHGPMYGHGFATLFLAECYGMSGNPELRDKLQSAVDLILSAQNDEGGWRYMPVPQDADLSVTICQIMALRAAKNAGIFVPNDAVNRCIGYVQRCQNQDGGFGYTPTDRSSLFPRSAAGVVALYSAGIYQGDNIERALSYLEARRPEGRFASRDVHFFYGQYYAALAMWHAGERRWDSWYPAIRDTLLPLQQPGGAWSDSVGPQYGTAMALIVLQTPNDMIPIFQR